MILACLEGLRKVMTETFKSKGHSPSADVLASTYALQLEQQDLIQEAAFVLLHLEGSSGCVYILSP